MKLLPTLITTLFWKTLQLSFMCFFIYLVYSQETAALRHISYNEMSLDKLMILKTLYNMKSKVLPGEFWRLVWPMIIVSISLIVFKKWRWYFITIIGFISSLLLIANKIHFDFFTSIISSSSFVMAHQLWDVRSSIVNVIKLEDIGNVAIFSVFIIVGILFNKFTVSDIKNNSPAFYLDKLIGIIFFLLALYSFHLSLYIPTSHVVFDDKGVLVISKNAIKKNTKNGITHRVLPAYRSSSVGYASTFGLFNYQIKDLMDYYSSKHTVKQLEKDALIDIVNQFEQKYNNNKLSSIFEGIAKGKNVFIIDLESFHPFLLNTSINEVPITPTLNLIKKQTLYWEYIISHSNRGGSADSEFSVLTGLLPLHPNKIPYIDVAREIILIALPKTLKQYHYDTFSFHGYKISYYNRNINHPLFGINTMYFKDSYFSSEKIGLGIPDRTVFTRALSLLRNQKTPLFSFIISLSTHHPYANILASDSDVIRYLQLVRYTDDALGSFIKEAKENGLWENSIFIIYGDHPPYLSKESIRQIHAYCGFSLDHIRERRVPLLILIPGQENLIAKYQKQLSTIVGGLCDVFPTILHLLGKEIPFGIFGTHLFVPNQKRDPLPVIGGYVYNGILYSEHNGKTLRDQYGLLYTDDEGALISNSENQQKITLQAQKSLLLHFDIFDYDAQKQAIDYKNTIDNS